MTVKLDAAMFVGLEIESVTYAGNAIYLALNRGFTIRFLTSIHYRTNARDRLREDRLPVSKSAVMSLVGESISAAARTSSGGLTLTLSNGGCVSVEDDSDQYESFSITTPDGEIFV